MLSRPDVGSKEHILSWLMTKDEAATYEWASSECPAAYYSREFGSEHSGLNLEWINNLAEIKPHTWGALIKRVEETT
jgi:hypothetical protein